MGHLKGKLLFTMLVVLVLDFSFLSLSTISPSNAQEVPLPLVYVDPPMIDNPLMVAGDTFTISINIANASNLFGWQVNMTFSPGLLNTTRAVMVEGTFMSDIAPTTFTKALDNVDGTLLISCVFDPQTRPPEGAGAYGDGWLTSITFTVRAPGTATLLQFVSGTKLKTLIGDVVIDIENFKTKDGGFDNRPINQNALPFASFFVQPVVPNQRGVVSFDASASYDPDTWLMSYYWDFGDGSNSTYIRGENLTTSTSHTFAQNGTYLVTLTVKDYDNVTATDSRTAAVLYDVAVIGVSSPQTMVVAGTPVQVDVTVVNNGDFLETFDVSAFANQNFIGNRTATDLSPGSQTTLHFTWNTTGTSVGSYVLKANATVSGETNLDDNEYVDGVVTIAKVGLFSYSVVVGGRTFIVQGNSTSSVGGLGLTEKKINLQVSGETGTSAFCNVVIPMNLLNASAPGAWIVNFDGNPWNYTATQNVTHYFIHLDYTHSARTDEIGVIGETVATPPVVQFTSSARALTSYESTALAGESIFFNASTSYDPDGTIQSWTWDFGDGETGNGETVNHSFTTFGAGYRVTLTVKDDEDLTNSTALVIEITDYPVADFTCTPNPPIANETVTFDASASQPRGGSIEIYSWQFGDGQTSTTTNTSKVNIVEHVYVAIGTYTVNLTVTDSEQLSNSVTMTIVVIGYPKANFTFTPHEPFINQAVNFDASTSQPNGGTITNYNWRFGDGQNSTDSSTTHSYTEKGTYLVELIVTDSEQLTDTTSILIIVSLQPESSLSISATPTILTLGQTTAITGALDPVLEGITVTVNYRLVAAATWSILDTETTDARGQYSCTWTPASTGSYQVKVSWEGNSTTQPCESQVELVTVQEAKQQTVQQDNTMLLYAVAAIVIILLVATAIYFLKIR